MNEEENVQTKPLTAPSEDPLFEHGLRIVKTLKKHDYTAYFAGGCVRDRLMGTRPEDYDIATDAPPDRVEELFSHTLSVGKAFGVIIVVIDGVEYDVARFRQDQEYEDGRRPTSVDFSSASEDVRRRDFTVNGLLWDPVAEQVLDYVEGLQDLNREVIRTIGPPEKRFTEDYLRMLRAPRFAAQLGFEIEEQTGNAIQKHADHLTEMAEERILDEFKKLISSPHPDLGIREMNRLHLLEHVAPEVDQLDELPHGKESSDTILDHVIRTLACWRRIERKDPDDLPALNKEERVFVGCSILYHAVDRSEADRSDPKVTHTSSPSILREKITTSLESLRASNKLIKTVRNIVVRLKQVLRADQFELADWKRWISDSNWTLVKWVCRSVLEASSERSDAPYEQLVSLENSCSTDELNPERLLTGDDLKDLGLEPGPKFGKLLEDVRRAQLNEEISSGKEALDLVRQRINTESDRDE